VFLADEFIEDARAHPGGEGSGGVHGLSRGRRLLFFKKILHVEKIRSAHRGAPAFFRQD
jgi:hypothetical protein